METRPAKYLTRLAVAGFVVLLWSVPDLAARCSERNRLYNSWEIQDAGWCLLPILVYSGLAVLVSIVVELCGKPVVQRAFNCLFLVALGGGLLTNVVHQLAKLRTYQSPLLDVANHLGWMSLAALAGYVFTRPDSGWLSGSKKLCLVCSPGVLLVAMRLFAGPVYPQQLDPLPLQQNEHACAVAGTVAEDDSRPGHGRPDVYWFIFDEWSYERSYEGGKLRPFFKNLKQFSRQAVVFRNARTQGTRTEISVPSMLYGTKQSPAFEDGCVGFRDGDGLIPPQSMESVLNLPGKYGYFRALVGFGLPYSKWIGEDLDLCRAYSFIDSPRGLYESFKDHAARTAASSADPLMKYLYRRWTRNAPYLPYYRQLHQNMRRDVHWVLTSSPRRTFAILHYMLPHKPYLFDKHGEKMALDPEMTTESVEAYDRHLACLDVRIGEFLDLLRNSGRYDDSLVIITSDHAWRADPLRRTGEHPVNHVPLMVKLPGQTEAREVDQEFQMYRIGELITSCLGDRAAAPLEVAQLLGR